MKRFTTLIVIIAMITSLLVPKNSYGEASLTITATPVDGKNCIRLEWTELGKGYVYAVHAKGQDEAVYQSIPSKTNVKVLNIYPNAGNELKTWMEKNGYGKGLITVDPVNITDFNNTPELYMKDAGGSWKYDVLYFGGYDCNNSFDISVKAKDMVETYIKEGYGVLFGHDTINSYLNHLNFNSLASYINISVDTETGYGDTTINVSKEGLLTNYPWEIGSMGVVLTTPMSHSSCQVAMGDIWMKYTSNVWNSNSELSSLDGKTGTNNFYLTTWNNCAMIQTGHSNGAATEDEQKLLANTLFYLAQLTNENSCDDHKSQDFAAPDSVNISSVTNDVYNLSVNYSKSNDNGTKYEFYVNAINENTGENITSNTASATNTSGLAGYSYVVDNNEDTEPDKKVDTTDLSISAPLSGLDLTKPVYIHINAIDNARNSSKTTHYKYNYVKPEIKLTATAVSEKNFIHLEWTNLGKGYLYKVFAKGQDEAVYQSIPSKTDVKVLNIYPNVGNDLKKWMETNGYGKGLITVDPINITDFNNTPESYMKDSAGNWKYDVLYFGGYDSNNSIDISVKAKDMVETYIKEGYGVLFGHDTINHPNFKSLASYVNISVGSVATYGNSTINVSKEGLLTNYPWEIGSKGVALTIPFSHSTYQFAMGDIWMKYTSNPWSSQSELSSLDGKTGTNNFYLTTWNNCAMIQTGHSNGAATEDEQKLLANTLFYLAQLTGDNFCDDHKSQDFAAPDSVSVKSVTNDVYNLDATYSESKDNGTKYEFYVIASNGEASSDMTSNTASATNMTGFAGYSYVVDNKEDTKPDDKIDTKDTTISVPLSQLDLKAPIYIHINAIDNAGNSSETTHYKYSYTKKEEPKPVVQNTPTSSVSNGSSSSASSSTAAISVTATPTPVVTTAPTMQPIPAAVPADIAVSITADKTVYTEYEEVIFTIKYKNNLKTDTGLFKITAQIPDNTMVGDKGTGEVNAKTITWQMKNLPGEGSGQLVYKVKTGQISNDETVISNTAQISDIKGLINTEDDKSTVKVMLRKQKSLNHKAYVVGYPGGVFKPENQITRAEVAVIFAKIMGLTLTRSKTKVYSDVEITHWANDYIDAVTKAGVFKGYKDNLFHPEVKITRAEFATVIARYMGVESVKPIEENYNDLSGHWAQNYIEEIKRLKIIEGYDDKTFRPDLVIKRSEAVTMVNKMLFRGPLKLDAPTFKDVSNTSWFFGQVEEAAREHEFYMEDGYEVMIQK